MKPGNLRECKVPNPAETKDEALLHETRSAGTVGRVYPFERVEEGYYEKVLG